MRLVQRRHPESGWTAAELHGFVAIGATIGAAIVRIAGNDDASLTEAARLAAAHGWDVVSDTSYPGDEDVPRDVMQGHGVLADELPDTAPDPAAGYFTHVLLQGGVGGLAAGIVSAPRARLRPARPPSGVKQSGQATSA